MTSLESTLFGILVAFRWMGVIVVAIIAMALLISEAAKSKLSPAKILTVAGSGVLAAVLFWTLPSIINYARSDADTIVPNAPVGGVYR